MFADLIKELRGKIGLSQGKLAKAIGVSPGNISDWEIGKTKPGYSALAALALFFDVSADYLLEIENRPGDPNASVNSPSHTLIERNLLNMFRFLDERGQEDVLDFVVMKYEKATGEKGSIYWTYIEDEKEQQKGESRQDEKGQSGTA